MLKIDFYYWSEQCPYNSAIRELLGTLKGNKEYLITIYDVSKDYSLAKEMNMFSPTLIVFNDELRWNGPISKQNIEDIAKGDVQKCQPYKVKSTSNIINGEIEFLTEDTVFRTCKTCSPSSENIYCMNKGSFLKEIRKKYNVPHLGVLHYVKNECVGGAEFIPSLAVPYDVPKGEDIAFLTCSFLSDEEFDYKSFPLIKLEEELIKMGYKTLISIVSEDVVFPNGTLNWFMEKGYKDLGEVFYEEREEARMHLISKELNY
jgi:hypothetical protein